MKNKKLLIYIVITIAIMAFIFVQSQLPADLSNAESDGIVSWLSSWLNTDAEATSFVVRKIAHGLEYLLLGIFLALSANEIAFRKHLPGAEQLPGRLFFYAGLCAWAIGTVYAVSDEVHQIFIEGRSCELRDMAIDSCGVLIGVFLTLLILSRRMRKNREDLRA